MIGARAGGDFARRARPGAGVNDDRDRGVTPASCACDTRLCAHDTPGGGARAATRRMLCFPRVGTRVMRDAWVKESKVKDED